MSRTRIGSERTALWMAHGRRCFYCGDPVQLRDLEIDHILPDSLKSQPTELERLKVDLGLPPSFTVDHLDNLVPTHRSCNSRKADRIFSVSNARYFLEIAQKKLDLVMRLIPSLELQASKENLLAAVQSAIESGDLSLPDIVDSAGKARGFPLGTRIEFKDGEWDGEACSKHADELLDRPVGFRGSECTDGVQFVNNSGDLSVVRTCREFRNAVKAGYHPRDNGQLRLSSFLMRASAVLDAASRSQLAAISFIESPHAGIADLHLLPASLFPITGPECQENTAQLGSTSLQDMLDSNKIRVFAASSIHLDVRSNEFRVVLSELLRADLDGDGMDEILVQRSIYAVRGSFSFYEIGLLRRVSSDARFEYEHWDQDKEWDNAQRNFLLARASR